MSKPQVFLLVALSVTVTVLLIGWLNDLDYRKRIRAINFEITRPTEVKARIE